MDAECASSLSNTSQVGVLSGYLLGDSLLTTAVDAPLAHYCRLKSVANCANDVDLVASSEQGVALKAVRRMLHRWSWTQLQQQVVAVAAAQCEMEPKIDTNPKSRLSILWLSLIAAAGGGEAASAVDEMAQKTCLGLPAVVKALRKALVKVDDAVEDDPKSEPVQVKKNKNI